MDKEKNIKTEKDIKKISEKKSFSAFQTNPIIQKMLFCNEEAKKSKFKLKDLFR